MIKQTPTNEILFLSFYELCQKKQIDKITIDDIVNNCGMKRGIFYYYYKDKNDLITSNIARITENIHKENYGIIPWEKIVEKNCENILKYRNLHYYMNKKNLINTNENTVFFFNYIYKIAKDYYGEVDEQLKDIIIFYCGGASELVKNWIIGNYIQSPKIVANHLVSAIHPKLLKALNKD